MVAKWQRATVSSKLHIDMDWWDSSNRDIRTYLREFLCEECRAEYGAMQDQQAIDWIDEATGEVQQVDALWHCLRTCCSTKTDYITYDMPIVEAVFRTFVANGNSPLSANELYQLLDRRPPAILLRILTGGPIYMGIRPLR